MTTPCRLADGFHRFSHPTSRLRRWPAVALVLAAALVLAGLPGAAEGAAGESSARGSLYERLRAEAPRLDPGVLDRALAALDCAAGEGALARPELLTVIDYSLPSTRQRLWVFDLQRRTLLFQERVAHGKNSGGDLATAFSNEMGSLQTSLGLFVTDVPYVGRNGYSLRLDGLEPGVNDRARERAIVMHGAPYVGDSAIASLGRLGRSWGCPAVRPKVARPLIDTIKGGSAVFAYYPDRDWLQSSRFNAARCGAPDQTTIASATSR